MIKLDKWQEEVKSYDGDLLLCTGRRVGKTYVLATKAIDEMAKHPNMPVVIMSLTEDQAMIILQMALTYAKEKYPGLIGRKQKKPTMKSLWLNNGHMIVRPMGASGEGVRGYEGGILIVDEAARAGKMFWLAALPILLTTNGRVWLGSTLFGKEGYFWERFNEAYNLKEPDARYKVFHISTEEAILSRPISESWTQEQRDGAIRILQEAKKEMTEAEYGQEYLAIASDDLQRFFPEEIIDELCMLKREKRAGDKFLGVDCAGLGEDLSTLEIFSVDRFDNIYHEDNIIMKKKLTTQLSDAIIELDKRNDFMGIGIDDGGVGFGVFSELINTDSTKRKTEALNNSRRPIDNEGNKTKNLLKEEMYENLKRLMLRRKIWFLDDDSVKASLKSMQWERIIKEGQQPRIRIFGRDSHICEGIIRAVQMASNSKNLNIWVSSIRI